MSNKTNDMYKIRQLLRLYAEGRGSKSISQAIQVASQTRKALNHYSLSGTSKYVVRRYWRTNHSRCHTRPAGTSIHTLRAARRIAP
jgi:hypothetical protein